MLSNKLKKDKFDVLCKEIGVTLPKLVEPFFLNKAFKSDDDLKDAIQHMSATIANEKNAPIINSLNEFIHAKIPNITLPMYGSTVSCGFTSPAEDHVESQLSLDEYLVPNPNATFFVRASGDSMTGAGIYDGDLLIIDRSIEVKNNHVVLAILDTEFTIKRFIKNNDKVFLKAENPSFDDIPIHPDQHLMVWGVVVHVIHHLK